MNLHEALRMNVQQIFDEFVVFAQEKNLEYEYDEGNYLWIKGNSNIALMAHVDTVDFADTGDKILKEVNGLLQAYRGGNRCILGADDRAGVSMIWNLIHNTNKIPHVMLFNYEEVGGIGCEKLISKKPNFKDIELMISLDCSYHNRYVWYGKTQLYPEAIKFVNSYGFLNDGKGIFTDMMIVGDYCDIPCFNIAVGYVNQHTSNEYLDMLSWNMTQQKVARLLYDADEIKWFDFKKVSDIVEEGILAYEEDINSQTYGKFW